MTRFFRTLLIALPLLAVSAPALAGSYYSAQPEAAPASAKLVARDTIWKCGPDGCFAGKSNSRPAVVCAVLVKQVGAVRSFSANGTALAPDQLEKCNAKAQ